MWGVYSEQGKLQSLKTGARAVTRKLRGKIVKEGPVHNEIILRKITNLLVFSDYWVNIRENSEEVEIERKLIFIWRPRS